MKVPRVTIDQWRTLHAVIDTGSYARAAETLHRSQSSVSYAIHRLESQLETEVLVIQGRKAELTDAGKIILERSRTLIEDAEKLEQLARDINNGRETEIRLIVDEAFPFDILVNSLKTFHLECGHTRILLEQVIMSGADELLQRGHADLAISHSIPGNMLADQIIQIEFLAVAHPEHKLHQQNRLITQEQLRDELQIVIRDSGDKQKRDSGWLGAKQQWSVPSIESSLKLIRQGMGYGWIPHHMIQKDLERGTLKVLPLREGQSYTAGLNLVFGNHLHIGPATNQLAEIIHQHVQSFSFN